MDSDTSTVLALVVVEAGTDAVVAVDNVRSHPLSVDRHQREYFVQLLQVYSDQLVAYNSDSLCEHFAMTIDR